MVWEWYDGTGGYVKVYGIWYDSKVKKLYIDIEVVPGNPNIQTSMKSAWIIAKDTATHGYVLESGVTGRALKTYTLEYDYYINWGVEIDYQTQYGGLFPAINIRRDQITPGSPPPKAKVTSVRYNNSVLDGGVIEYEAGKYVTISVNVQNVGVGGGTLFCVVIDKSTNQPYEGGEMKVSEVNPGSSTTFKFIIKMPDTQKDIRIDCGHRE